MLLRLSDNNQNLSAHSTGTQYHSAMPDFPDQTPDLRGASVWPVQRDRETHDGIWLSTKHHPNQWFEGITPPTITASPATGLEFGRFFPTMESSQTRVLRPVISPTVSPEWDV
jgi:hypothetical protein